MTSKEIGQEDSLHRLREKNRVTDPELLEFLKHPEADIRLAATRLAGEKAVRGGFFHALLILAEDSDERISQSAVESLSQIRDPSATSILIRRLKYPDKWIRVRAAQSLHQLADPAAVPALLEALETPDEDIQQWLAQAILECGELSLRVCAQMIKNQNIWRRTYAYQAFGRLKDSRCLPILDQARQDPDLLIRLHAVQDLSVMDDKRTIHLLKECLFDSASSVREAAARAMRNHTSPETIGLLIKVSDDDPDLGVRTAAALAMQSQYPSQENRQDDKPIA